MPNQPMGHGDDGLVDPRPVLLVTLAKAFFRARTDHGLVPGLELVDVVLEAADRRRHYEEKDAGAGYHAGHGRPVPPPDEIRQHRDRKHLDGGGKREHEARKPGPLMLEAPEAV